MDREPIAASTAPAYPTLQQALRQRLVETAADAVFLAMPTARRAGGSFSIVAWYPSVEQSARLMTRWIREAVIHTLASGRTLLATGRWHAALDRPKRSALAIVTSVLNGDGAVCGALAVILPATETDSEVIALMERGARETAEVLARHGQIPALSTPTQAHAADRSGRSNHHLLMHELRVPLSAASYALEALAMRPTAEWERENEHLIHTAQLGLMEAQSIVRSANQLQAIGSGRATMSLRAVSLATALERALELFPAAHARLQLDLHNDLPAIRADELWLTQVLTNLLENALKFSWPHTRITVAARPSDRDRVLITVRSFGEDFPADLQQLFKHDALDATTINTTINPASKGLGLSIARHFITGMGGDIWIERDEQGATDVNLSLPVAAT